MLRILYQDDSYVAVDKPSGLFVHRSAYDRRSRDLVLQRLRDQLGQHVHPVHRLDRATSGVLVFALSRAAAGDLMAEFRERRVDKTYLAVVRGFANADGTVDRPIEGAEARTRWRLLDRAELPIPVGGFPSARYSLLALHPATGRHHQLRRHLAAAGHPILGDSTHGDNRQNRAFRDHTGVGRLMLHAWRLAFDLPNGGGRVELRADPGDDWAPALAALGWSIP